MAEGEKFDGILLNVAQQVGSIDGILEHFFGFLHRKTDFFSGAQDEQAAQELVLKYFQKYWKEGVKKREETAEKNKKADDERKQRAEEKRKKDEAEYQKRQEEMAKKEEQPKIEEITEEEAEQIKADKAAKKDAKDEEALKEAAEKEVAKHEGDEDEESSKEPPPPGNGGTTDKYFWTQTLSALEVHVHVRPGVKAREVVCDIGTETLKVGLKGEPLLIQGKMFGKVKPDDCMWTLVDNKIVQISLEKLDGMKWWSCVMQGDPGIDTKKIVPENSKLSDLDGETRMTVEKMMYDQRQKALGKPTSDQEKQHELLEKFKAAHPEMDFSKAKINYGGAGQGSFNFGG